MNYTIVGTGAAGRAALREILRFDAKASITLITQEIQSFYQRPFLADYVAAKISLEDLFIDLKDAEANDRVTLLSTKKVIEVIPKDNLLRFSDGTTHQYNFLLISSGAVPALGDLERFHVPILTLRSLADAQRLRQAIFRDRPTVILFGGGYQAIEIARVLHAQAVPFTFLSTDELFWKHEIYGLKANDILTLLGNHGVDVSMNETIRDVIDLDGITWRAFTSKGRCLDCTFIISAQGDRPNIDFLKNSGLALEKGLLVNEELRTNISNIYAAGDVAQVYDLNRGINRINFGWKSASRQGTLAGQNMAGADKVFIPTNNDFFIDLLGKNYLERW
jgi:NAD(P)H-nitrite reductase large subunit